MRRLVLAVCVAAIASCGKSTAQPGELNDPNLKPPIVGGGGGDGGTSDATTDAPPAASCIEVPTLLNGFVAQRVLYVAPDGNDANDGLTRSTAWRSLSNLGGQLQPGDRVDVAAGTYDCSSNIGVKGTASRPVWIRSVDGPKKAIFQCGGAGFGVHIVSAKYVVIDGFDISEPQIDGILIESGSGPTFTDLADHIVVVNNHVHTVGAAGVHVTQATNIDIFSNEIDTTEAFGPNLGAQGIDLVAVSGARVVGNSVHDIRNNTAIQARGGAFGTRIAANTITNALEGIHLGGNSDRPFFLPPDASVEAKGAVAHSNLITGGTSIAFAAIGCDSCLIANNTVAITAAAQPIRALAGNTGENSSASVSHTIDLRLVNNIFYFSTVTPTNMINMASTEETGFSHTTNLFFLLNGTIASVASDVAVGGSGTIVDKDPLFRNSSAGDFTLSVGSPAASVGTPLTADVGYDGAGACRVKWNIGAF